MDACREQLRHAQDIQKVAKNSPDKIGKVLYSSGEAVSNKSFIIDWAIVENPNAEASKHSQKKLPDSQNSGLFGKLANFYGTGELNYVVRPDAPRYARNLGEIEKGK